MSEEKKFALPEGVDIVYPVRKITLEELKRQYPDHYVMETEEGIAMVSPEATKEGWKKSV